MPLDGNQVNSWGRECQRKSLEGKGPELQVMLVCLTDSEEVAQ